jgi:hypothetical protein
MDSSLDQERKAFAQGHLMAVTGHRQVERHSQSPVPRRLPCGDFCPTGPGDLQRLLGDVFGVGGIHKLRLRDADHLRASMPVEGRKGGRRSAHSDNSNGNQRL